MRMRIASAVVAFTGMGLLTGLLEGCVSSACSTGTHKEGDNCVADSAGATNCGPNTTLDTTDNTCKIQASACGPGTVFNDTTSACQVDTNHGEALWNSTMNQTWDAVFYQPVPGGGPATIIPVGTPGGPDPAVPDDTKLVMADESPWGGQQHIPTSWGSGAPDSEVMNALTEQLTVGDWKKCKASWSLYKNPPNAKAGNLRVVVQVQGCPPNISFSLWHSFYTDDKYADLYMATPLGGVPSAFNTNADGTGYFERDLDPAIWFKAGASLAGASHGPPGTPPTIPSLTDFPNATYSVDLVYHSNGQSNGNAGWCARDASNNCVASPSPNLFLPGQFGIDAGGIYTGATVDGGGLATTKPMPLSMLQ